ncbi:MAG TPA: hypothetical protein VJJ80_01215 [Patescibacteria group bacterium]|nr:hypothetical protein [Patescibacteria group bacterium]
MVASVERRVTIGCFSIEYEQPDKFTSKMERFAVDFGHQGKQWSGSHDVGGSRPWDVIREGLDHESWKVIMNHFGLVPVQHLYPLEIIEKLTPGQLVSIRRKIEEKYHLASQIILDANGEPVLAEDLPEDFNFNEIPNLSPAR